MTGNGRRIEGLVAIVFVLGTTSVASIAQDRSSASQTAAEEARLTYSAPVGLTGDGIVAKMLERNRLRNEQLRRYSAVRTYDIRNPEGKLAAQALVRVDYRAPDKKTSFWINRADFVRQYQRIDGFWLPCRDETVVEVKMYGRRVFTVDHQQYVINPANPLQAETGDMGDRD